MTAPPKVKDKSLREAAFQRDLLYGTAICTSDLAGEPRRRAIVRDCSLITPEYEMKWNVIAKGPSTLDYSAADELVTFAQDSGCALHGHTLWWHEAVPEHLQESPREAFAQAALSHLEQTMARYAGRLHSWDVINESIDLDQGRTDGLRPSHFLEAFGPDYIAIAFARAQAMDPNAILVLNEMGLEYDSPDAERKRRAMLALLERELGRGTPIHCLGIQSHLDAMDQPRNHPDLRAFLQEIQQLGLSVMITEMDVSDRQCTGTLAERDGMVADTYRAYIDLVLGNSRTLSVSTWGLSDDRSWLNAQRNSRNARRLRPLPLNSALKRKPAWHAIRDAFLSS